MTQSHKQISSNTKTSFNSSKRALSITFNVFICLTFVVAAIIGILMATYGWAIKEKNIEYSLWHKILEKITGLEKHLDIVYLSAGILLFACATITITIFIVLKYIKSNNSNNFVKTSEKKVNKK